MYCKNVYSYKNRIIAKILGQYTLPPIARIFHSFLSLPLASNLNIELTPPLDRYRYSYNYNRTTCRRSLTPRECLLRAC
jgi:hypothetical protein